MNKFDIIKIKSNTLSFDKSKYLDNKNLLKTDLLPHLEILPVTRETFMETIIDVIKVTEKLLGNTGKCYEDDKHVYEICYLDTSDENLGEIKSIPNDVASCLIQDKVYGECVFIRNKINLERYCENMDAGVDDVVDLVYVKLIHRCLVVKSDGTVAERVFLENPLEKEVNFEDFKSIEIPFLGFNMIGYFRTKNDGVVNKKATRLLGNKTVKGDFVVAHKSTEFEFQDFTEVLFNRIMENTWGPYHSRDLQENEKPIERVDGQLERMLNKHIILKGRSKNCRSFCEGCREKLNQKYILCSGCFRSRYNDDKCRKGDWEFHKSDCLFGKTPLN